MLLFCDAALISRSGEIVTHTPLLVPGVVSSFRNTALRVESGVRRVTLDPHPARRAHTNDRRPAANKLFSARCCAWPWYRRMSVRPDGADLNDACRDRKRGVAKRLIQARANLHYTNVRSPYPHVVSSASMFAPSVFLIAPL